MKHTSRPGEPFSKFSTGDRSTLSVPNVRESLLDFYQKYYSSNLMKLVVYSNEVVDKTAEMVGNLFSLVSNKQLVSFRLPNAPFDPSILNNLYRIVPIRSTPLLTQIKRPLNTSGLLATSNSITRTAPESTSPS